MLLRYLQVPYSSRTTVAGLGWHGVLLVGYHTLYSHVLLGPRCTAGR